MLVSLPSYAACGLSGTTGFSRLQLQLNLMPGLRETMIFSLNLANSKGVTYKGELRNVQIPWHESA